MRLSQQVGLRGLLGQIMRADGRVMLGSCCLTGLLCPGGTELALEALGRPLPCLFLPSGLLPAALGHPWPSVWLPGICLSVFLSSHDSTLF